MRLIDADNLLKQYERIDWFSISKEGQVIRGATTDDNPFIHYYDGEDIIKNAPTVDAVEVVRCRECKFGTHFGDMEDEWIRCMNLHGNPLMPFDGFCSYGERKEGAD